MGKLIKIALLTTGLVVGVVVGRNKRVKKLEVKITDLDVYKKHISDLRKELNHLKGLDD